MKEMIGRQAFLLLFICLFLLIEQRPSFADIILPPMVFAVPFWPAFFLAAFYSIYVLIIAILALLVCFVIYHRLRKQENSPLKSIWKTYLYITFVLAIVVGAFDIYIAAIPHPRHSSADAAKIINDLRNLKATHMLFMADKHIWPHVASGDLWASTEKHFDRSIDKRYERIIVNMTEGNGVYASIYNPDAMEISDIRQRFERTAKTNLLYDEHGEFYRSTNFSVFIRIK